jgi:tRNA U34 2-thiouridine synthase MnmA/TrmU
MMFRIAGEIMAEQGFDFLFSGEVLGQRPMSQNLSALQAVAKHSGMSGRILRPMSARLLPETPMESEGLVDRSRLLDIQGRSRRRQAELAESWGVTDYPASGGGCLLTEKSFSGRLRDLFAHQPKATVVDVELLKLGRQFRLSPQAKLTVGRDQESNEAIKALARSEDILLHIRGVSGPVGLVSGMAVEDDLRAAGGIVASYGRGQDKPVVEVALVQGEKCWSLHVTPMERSRSTQLIVN